MSSPRTQFEPSPEAVQRAKNIMRDAKRQGYFKPLSVCQRQAIRRQKWLTRIAFVLLVALPVAGVVVLFYLDRWMK